MKKILITAFSLALAVPALAAQQNIAQISAVTASREALRTAVNTQLSAVQANFDEIYTAVGTRPWVIQATAPADTTLAWFDTDQVVDAVVLKIHNGERWVPQAIGEEGSYTLPTAAADTLGGVKVGARLTITDGVLSADVQAGGESTTVGDGTTGPYLDGTVDGGTLIKLSAPSGGNGTWTSLQGGNPTANRNWRLPIDAPPAAGTTRLINVDENTQMGLVDPATFLTPTGSADSLTITDTGAYFTADTVAAALQELGSGLADVTEITLDASLTETGGVLSVTNPATDYDTDGDGDFTDEAWFPAAGIGGSTGSTDNAILRANGTGGSTAQASGVTIDDNDNITTAGFITGLMQPVVITTAEGADDTSTDAAFLTDSGETWPTNAYVGMTLYNVTDGSSCVVTANTATTMTCTLAGGTDNDWDTADAWAVAPGPKQSGSMFYIGSATTILHPAIAGYGVCYMTTGANAVSVDPQSASMALYLNGATIGDGDEIDIPNAAGNYACLHNKSATVGYVLGTKGTIADGGSN